MHDPQNIDSMGQLEPATRGHVAQALALHADPSRVRALLAGHAGRVALTLDDPTLGPFVVVAPDGLVERCLPRGAIPDAPVLATPTLGTADEGELPRLWRAMRDGGHRVPREVMAALMRVAPLFDQTVMRLGAGLVDQLRLRLQGADALRARAEAWGPADLAEAEAIWRDLWSLGHLVLLMHSGTRASLVARQAPIQKLGPHAGLSAFSMALALPCKALQLRVAWACARLGPTLLGAALPMFTRLEPYYPDADALAYALAALAYTAPEQRARVITTLRADTRKNTATSAIAADLRADRWTLESARHELTRLDREARALPGGDALSADASYGGAFAATLYGDGVCFDDELQSMLRLLPWLVQAEAEELYWPQIALHLEGAWTPKLTRDFLSHFCKVDSTLHAQSLPLPGAPAKLVVGRNDPCPCGSGKKYKKCCGQ